MIWKYNFIWHVIACAYCRPIRIFLGMMYTINVELHQNTCLSARRLNARNGSNFCNLAKFLAYSHPKCRAGATGLPHGTHDRSAASCRHRRQHVGNTRRHAMRAPHETAMYSDQGDTEGGGSVLAARTTDEEDTQDWITACVALSDLRVVRSCTCVYERQVIAEDADRPCRYAETSMH